MARLESDARRVREETAAREIEGTADDLAAMAAEIDRAADRQLAYSDRRDARKRQRANDVEPAEGAGEPEHEARDRLAFAGGDIGVVAEAAADLHNIAGRWHRVADPVGGG
jgi:hypothetical protein